MKENYVIVTRRTRNIGWAVNASPQQYWNESMTESHLGVPAPTQPEHTGTFASVTRKINNDRFYQSLKSGGTYYTTAWFVGNRRIDTNSEAWQYEIESLVNGEIDQLTLPLI